MWVGTNQNGVGVYDGINWVNYTTANSGLLANRIMSITEDHDSVMWIGTDGGGLSSFDGAVWTTYMPVDPDLGRGSCL